MTMDYSKPRITKRGAGIVVTIWFFYTLLATVPLVQFYHVSFLQAFRWQAYQSIMMLCLSIPAWLITIRWMHAVKWYWKVFVHIFIAPTYAILNYKYLYDMVAWFGSETKAEPLSKGSGWIVYFNFTIYVLQFALYHSYEIFRRKSLPH
jgi:hypothetical protein